MSFTVKHVAEVDTNSWNVLTILKVYVREPAAPFISMAEMMKKFQSNTREMSLTCVNGSLSHVNEQSIFLLPLCFRLNLF